jgi:hypothetical protein
MSRLHASQQTRAVGGMEAMPMGTDRPQGFPLPCTSCSCCTRGCQLWQHRQLSSCAPDATTLTRCELHSTRATGSVCCSITVQYTAVTVLLSPPRGSIQTREINSETVLRPHSATCPRASHDTLDIPLVAYKASCYSSTSPQLCLTQMRPAQKQPRGWHCQTQPGAQTPPPPPRPPRLQPPAHPLQWCHSTEKIPGRVTPACTHLVPRGCQIHLQLWHLMLLLHLSSC